MLNVNEKKLEKNELKILYAGLIFFVLGFIFFIWAFYITSNTKNYNLTLHDIIKNGDSKENQIVSLTVTEVPYVFAEYDSKEKSDKYYFLADEDYLYVGYLDYDTYKKLSSDDINTNNITIKGVTKKIPSDVIDIAIEVYNEELGEEFLTKGNYKNYIGEVCINTVSDLVNNAVQIVFGIIFVVISIVYFVLYVVRKNKVKKIKNSSDWSKVSSELDSSNTVSYDKYNLFLTSNYIVDGLKGLTVIPYQDIIWVYLYEYRYNGIVCNRKIMVVTRDGKKQEIAGISGIHRSKNNYMEILENISSRCPNALVGFNGENQKKIKEMLKKNK